MPSHEVSRRPEPAEQASGPPLVVRLLVEVEVGGRAAGSAPTAEALSDSVRDALDGLPATVRATSVRALGTTQRSIPVRGVFDLVHHELAVDDEPVKLTPRESALLAYLVRRPGQAVTREELRTALDDSEAALGPRAVDVILSRLRAKLSWGPAPVATVRGIGYRYEPSDRFVVVDEPAGGGAQR